MIIYSDNQIEAARKGIERDLLGYLGYNVIVGLVPNTGHDIKFVARGLGFCHAKKFDELCSYHLARVANINYDDQSIADVN